MSSNFREQPPGFLPHESRRAKPRRFTVAAISVYALLAMTFAAIWGLRLHDWARQRMVDTSILAQIDLTTVPDGAAIDPAIQSTPRAPLAAAQATQQAAAAQPEAAAVRPINILLLGTDERPDEYGPSRTDTIILLTINPSDRSMGMLSLPRDLWVPVPGLGTTTKINTAYLLGELNGYPGGGAQLAKDTVSSFIGRPVDYYVQVNFDGFTELVDLIGGIDIDVPYTIHDEEYPTADYGVETFHLDAGLQHLDGEMALKFARTRHTDDDYSRSRRQQDLIRAVASKVLNANMIPQLLPRVPQLLLTAQNSIQTDIPMALGLELANLTKGSSLQEVRQLVLDNRFGEETYSSEGAWILLPDRSRVRAALDEFFAPPSIASGGATPIATGDVRIEVLNGTGQPGVATLAAEMLQSAGWQVVAIGEADRSDYLQTIVINYGAPDTAVARVSADLNLEPTLAMLNGLNSTSPVDMRIVVGSDLLSTLK